MRIRVIAVGTRMPARVDAAVQDYLRRLPRELAVSIEAIKPAVHRDDALAVINDEGKRLLQRAAGSTRLIMLDERGVGWSTAELARQLEQWQQQALDVALLVGGADGHSAEVRAAAHEGWSLSALTLPHALVRVVIVEQIYRAQSMLRGHPYHRA